MRDRAQFGQGVNPHVKRRVAYSLLPVAFMGLLYYVSSVPGNAVRIQVRLPDYVMHAGGYAILCTLVYVALRRGWGMLQKTSMGLSWMISVLYGVVDEYHQSFVPGRTPEFRDVLADGVGALLALVAIYVMRSVWLRRVKSI